MAHLRARILSKNGESTRLGNKRDGMIVEVNGNGWRIETRIAYCEHRDADMIYFTRVDQRTGQPIGEMTILECPVVEGSR